jgi:hypothetical protein
MKIKIYMGRFIYLKIIFIVLFNIVECQDSFAQRPVHQEPQHKPIFENEAIRVLELKFSPGDTSLFHLHDTPILYITLSDTKMWLQEKREDGRTVKLPSGWTGSDFYNSDTTLIHRIANVGDSVLHWIAVQVKNQVSKSENSQMSNSGGLYTGNAFLVEIVNNPEYYFEQKEAFPLIIKVGS